DPRSHGRNDPAVKVACAAPLAYEYGKLELAVALEPAPLPPTPLAIGLATASLAVTIALPLSAVVIAAPSPAHTNSPPGRTRLQPTGNTSPCRQKAAHTHAGSRQYSEIDDVQQQNGNSSG
ncbi:MAG: hypothetical protein NW223_07155, partial [Hyphomicrobiaceae bacterium]|nr:hypothetical protein [Hyphomicrobiaceae bacterium]